MHDSTNPIDTTLWRHGDFMRMWSAQAISAFGSRISRTVLPIIALATIGATPLQMGVLSALSVAPGIVVGLLVGGHVDRSGKRILLVACDLIRAALLFTVPAAAWCGMLSMPHLYLVAAGVGAASVLFQIADNAYLPALVGKECLVEANSKLESTDAVAEIGGPSFGGILVDLVTAPVAVVFDALSYLVSAGLLLSIHAPGLPLATEEEEANSLAGDFRAGIQAALGHPLVRPIFFAETMGSLFNGFFFSLYMIYTLETLGISAGVVGVLIGLGGVGALFGAILSRHAARIVGLGNAIILLAAAARGCTLLIPLAQGPDPLSIALLAAHQLISDGLMVTYMIYTMSLCQVVLPQSLLGRAHAVSHVMNASALVLGALVAGALGNLIGVRESLWLGMLGGMAMPAILALSPLRALRKMPAPT